MNPVKPDTQFIASMAFVVIFYFFLKRISLAESVAEESNPTDTLDFNPSRGRLLGRILSEPCLNNNHKNNTHVPTEYPLRYIYSDCCCCAPPRPVQVPLQFPMEEGGGGRLFHKGGKGLQ